MSYTLDEATLFNLATAYLETSEFNTIPANLALSAELSGMRIFDTPIFAIASASDPLFEQMKQPHIIGSHFMEPGLWQEGAQSVISYFLPFTKEVIKSNKANRSWPSNAWLHARVEGQAMIGKLGGYLENILIQAGYPSVAPVRDSRFWRHSNPTHVMDNGELFLGFTTNWSERHVGYIAGLGTFGLSAGLITQKGMAGRIGSVITTLKLSPTQRPYTSHDEYCIHCGLCIARCPVGAISTEGKNHVPCSILMDETRGKCYPRFGCGKCQVSVPCERHIPHKRHTKNEE